MVVQEKLVLRTEQKQAVKFLLRQFPDQVDKIGRKEFNKLSNPIYDFKFYIKFCDVLCFLLIFISFWLTILEPIDELKFNFSIFFNQMIQIIIIILHFIRLNKFVEVKNFLFDNEDIYDI